LKADVRGMKLEGRIGKPARKLAAAAALLGALLVTLAPYAAAQGCAMCYQSAAAAPAAGRDALRHGILILLCPTLSLFVGIFGLIYRRRNVSR
jgi:hypothetical protein